MTRPTLLFLFLPVAAIAGNDAISVFQSCAWVNMQDPSAGPTRPTVEILNPHAPAALPEDHRFRKDERFVVRVSGAFPGAYTYIFQNPADPETLLYPSPKAAKQTRAAATSFVSPVFRMASVTNFSLYVAVTAEPISDAARKTAPELLQYLTPRAACQSVVLRELNIRFSPQ